MGPDGLDDCRSGKTIIEDRGEDRSGGKQRGVLNPSSGMIEG